MQQLTYTANQEVFPIEKYNGDDTVDSRIVATELGVQHKNLLETIRTHQQSIEVDFGRVAFETLPLETNGGTQIAVVAHLTFDQSLFIGTLSRNTEKVVRFKAKLVKSFSLAKKVVQSVQQMPNFNNPAEAARAWANEYEQKQIAIQSLQIAEQKVENLQIGLDNMLNRVSILKVALHNKISERLLNWRVLKKKSQEMGLEIIKTESNRFPTQNLYHVDVFRICYPQYNYDFKIREYN